MAKLTMNHGSGGEIMQDFISKHVTAHFPKMDFQVPLDALDDSAVIDDIVFTSDGHTVKPPGGRALGPTLRCVLCRAGCAVEK